MAAFYTAAAAAFRNGMRKVLETNIDQASACIETGDIDGPAVYHMTCSTLGSAIETAIPIKAVPSSCRLSQLLLIVKEVYRHNTKLLEPSLLMLMMNIKSACQAGWFSDEDKDCLLIMADNAALGYCDLDNTNIEPSHAQSVSDIMSRFYPSMKVEHIVTLIDVEAGHGPFVAEFPISPDTVHLQDLWLLVARTDNMDTAACLISPSNVDFLINHREVPKRTQKNMGKGPQLPSNVSKMVKGGINHLQVVGEFDGKYVIALAFMNLISSDPPLLQDFVHPMSSEVSDCRITKGSSRISLKCPNCHDRIRTPVKGHLCNHNQCFDYEFFMKSNSMRPTWKCPICKKPICNLDIRIDQNFLKILNEVANNIDDVIISDDGSWTGYLTEKRQINRVTINQHNHVPDNTENPVSLEANETPPMSSSAFNNIVSSATNMTVECPTAFEQPTVTILAVSPPQVVRDSQQNHVPDNTEHLVSLEPNEIPPMSSSALNDIGSLAINMNIECPSAFEQPTITTPAISPPQVIRDSPLMSQSSRDMVHTPPLVQQTRHHSSPEDLTATELSTQIQPQQGQTDGATEAVVDTGITNRARITTDRCRLTTVYTPVQLTPHSAAPASKLLGSRSQANVGSANQAQGTSLITPATKRGRKQKMTTGPDPAPASYIRKFPPTQANVGTTNQAQGTTLITPAKKRGRTPKIITGTDPVPASNIRRLSTTRVQEPSGDEMSFERMKGGLEGKELETARVESLAPPRQPVDANEPWPRPTPTAPMDILMKLLPINNSSNWLQ